jgi:hypothetical protein
MENLTFYTYLWLREDGTPYYVGKGTKKRAWRKGSPPSERVLIQEFPSEEDAFLSERFLIALYGREDLLEGCLINLTDGGDNPPLSTPASRAKAAATTRGQKRPPLTAEWRRKISEAKKGKPRPWEVLTESSKKKISMALRGRTGIPRSHKGKPWSIARRAAYEKMI